MPSRPTVAVINAVLANGGDAAILLGIRRALAEACEPAPALIVFDAHPGETAARYPDLDVRPAVSSLAWIDDARGLSARVRRAARWLVDCRRVLSGGRALGAGRPLTARRLTGEAVFGVLDALHRADAVVSTGGTYLTETYWLGPRLFEFHVLRTLRRPVALYTQSLGPFRKRGVRRALRKVFGSARTVLLRDARSLEAVRELAPNARTSVRADAAFGLAEASVLARAASRTWPERGARVCVSVRDWPYFVGAPAGEGMKGYRAAVAQAVAHLVREHGAEVTFLSTCQGTPGYRYDDAAVAEEIADALEPDVRVRVRVETGPQTPAALMEAYAEADLVLATRMHAAILALASGTPAVAVAYEFKTAELFETLGVPGWAPGIEGLTGEALVRVLDDAIEALPHARAGLFARVEAMRADALAAGREVAEALGLPLREASTPSVESPHASAQTSEASATSAQGSPPSAEASPPSAEASPPSAEASAAGPQASAESPQASARGLQASREASADPLLPPRQGGAGCSARSSSPLARGTPASSEGGAGEAA